MRQSGFASVTTVIGGTALAGVLVDGVCDAAGTPNTPLPPASAAASRRRADARRVVLGSVRSSIVMTIIGAVGVVAAKRAISVC